MKNLYILSFLICFLCMHQSLAQTHTVKETGVSIIQGPTPIPNGDALDQADITLQNSKFAVSFSVRSSPPWGVARGGILDLSIINDGEYSDDLASLVDFMPNN